MKKDIFDIYMDDTIINADTAENGLEKKAPKK